MKPGNRSIEWFPGFFCGNHANDLKLSEINRMLLAISLSFDGDVPSNEEKIVLVVRALLLAVGLDQAADSFSFTASLF